MVIKDLATKVCWYKNFPANVAQSFGGGGQMSVLTIMELFVPIAGRIPTLKWIPAFYRYSSIGVLHGYRM
jgi:hypothetical protein